MAEPTEGEYDLVMPFVVCGEDGPYDDGSFVAGWVCGRADAQLKALEGTRATIEFYADPRLVPQLDLIAMHHGLTLTHEPWEEHPDEWTAVTIGPTPAPLHQEGE